MVGILAWHDMALLEWFMAWKLPWARLEAELPKVKSWVLGTKIGQRGEQGARADSVNGYLQ